MQKENPKIENEIKENIQNLPTSNESKEFFTGVLHTNALNRMQINKMLNCSWFGKFRNYTKIDNPSAEASKTACSSSSAAESKKRSKVSSSASYATTETSSSSSSSTSGTTQNLNHSQVPTSCPKGGSQVSGSTTSQANSKVTSNATKTW